jgi:hypothetical protein
MFQDTVVDIRLPSSEAIVFKGTPLEVLSWINNNMDRALHCKIYLESHEKLVWSGTYLMMWQHSLVC